MITNFKIFESFLNKNDWPIWDIKEYIDTKYPAKGGIGIRVRNEKELVVDLDSIRQHYYSDKNYLEKGKETYQDIKTYLIKMGFKQKEQYTNSVITYVWDLPDIVQKFNI